MIHLTALAPHRCLSDNQQECQALLKNSAQHCQLILSLSMNQIQKKMNGLSKHLALRKNQRRTRKKRNARKRRNARAVDQNDNKNETEKVHRTSLLLPTTNLQYFYCTFV